MSEEPHSEIVKEWDYEDVRCKLKKVVLVPEGKRHMTMLRGYHYCGYVRIPGRSDGSVDTDELRVHGGVTYGVDTDGWIGFDADHYMDEPGHYNADNAIDVDGWLTEETESLAQQILKQIGESDE